MSTRDDDFDWTDLEDDLVVPTQDAIAVYTNPKNDVVIRQAGRFDISEDHWVVLHQTHALPLARAILAAAGLDMEIVPLTALRIQNGGGEVLQPFPDQRTIDAVRNAGRAADAAETKKDRTAAERQRRHRERQRERDSHGADRDMDVTDRDTVTSVPLVPELELNGGQNKALAH
jgi:hypothetical protein